MNAPRLLLLSALLLPAAVTTAAEGKARVEAGPAAGGTLVVPLAGSLPLQPAPGMFADGDTSLHDATVALRQALRAPENTLVLDLSGGFAPTLAAAEELAEVLRAERQADPRPARRVVALVDGLDDRALVLTAACDEVVMSEAGVLMAMGLYLDSWYLGDALARIGVKVHAVASGEHKTAHEAFTRNAPSPAAKADLRRLVDGLDASLLRLAGRPPCPSASLAAARAEAPQTAERAVALRLADRAAETGDWLAALPEPVRWQQDAGTRNDLGSLAGLLSFWRLLVDGEDRPRHPRVVAVVELEGEIVEGGDSVPGETIAGEDTSEVFADLAEDERVVAVVVRINSPGGSAGASDRIHHAIRRCIAKDKPVVALFDSVAASGGYYIGCAANEVLVHRTTITGSIGVFAMMPDASGALGLLGIGHHAVGTGPRAGLDDLASPFDDERRRALEAVIAATDHRFHQIVARGRNLPVEQVAALAGGRVWTGEEAVANGLADGFGTLAVAVAHARARAGVAEQLPLERLPRHRGLLARLGLARTAAGVLPARLRLWADAARRRAPTMMAWTNLHP